MDVLVGEVGLHWAEVQVLLVRSLQARSRLSNDSGRGKRTAPALRYTQSKFNFSPESRSLAAHSLSSVLVQGGRYSTYTPGSWSNPKYSDIETYSGVDRHGNGGNLRFHARVQSPDPVYVNPGVVMRTVDDSQSQAHSRNETQPRLKLPSYPSGSTHIATLLSPHSRPDPETACRPPQTSSRAHLGATAVQMQGYASKKHLHSL